MRGSGGGIGGRRGGSASPC
uniref:Uncharacterized protein n=1 Tax=Arundo donax TaxID=35708 RepID=A0A0A8YBJ8_ARUDO